MIIGMSPPRFIKRFSYFLLSIFYFFIFFLQRIRDDLQRWIILKIFFFSFFKHFLDQDPQAFVTASTPTHPANLSMKQNDGSSGPPSNGGMHGYSLVFVFSRNSKHICTSTLCSLLSLEHMK